MFFIHLPELFIILLSSCQESPLLSFPPSKELLNVKSVTWAARNEKFLQWSLARKNLLATVALVISAISPPFAKTKALEGFLQRFWGRFHHIKFSLHLIGGPRAAQISIQHSALINIRVFSMCVCIKTMQIWPIPLHYYRTGTLYTLPLYETASERGRDSSYWV